jgi:hypothetical protein
MPIGERQLRNILPGCRPAARSGAASAATGLPAEFAV